jgi:prolyl-tRNA editing enzyme YbaK/EbsC (Cys-tRNA(Pro) deacylase)
MATPHPVLKRAMPVYVESSILELPLLYINGGARGFLVAISPGDLTRVLKTNGCARR